MISHELKFVYVHIPKTGGSSLSLFLKDYVANKISQEDNTLGKGFNIDVYCEILKGHHADIFPQRPMPDGTSYDDHLLDAYDEIDRLFHKTKIVRAKESSKPPLPGRPMKHEPLIYYNNLYGKKINDYCKFAVVRNPYDLMMSLYFFENIGRYFEPTGGVRRLFGKAVHDYRRERFDREHFIKFITADQHAFTSIPFAMEFRQYYYVITRDGDLDCNIIHFENMLEELKQLECLKSLDFANFPKINVADKNFSKQGNSNPLKYREFYDNELADIVYDKYQADFRLFNYKKELD